ncbi:MAG: ABC transporter permease [Planctomycetota bacterium]
MTGPHSRIGGLLLLVRRSLRQHAVSTLVTSASVALGIGLVMAVFALSTQTRAAFAGGSVGFDAVLGARGSPLQLVLNTVFHLETSPGNLPWSMVKSLQSDDRIAAAVPYAVGDSYRGFRVVGTTNELFTDFELVEGKQFRPRAGGRLFDPTRREAVLGDVAARRTGLRVGDTFQPRHGVDDPQGVVHDEQYLVVGVLEPTNSPSDRVIWIPLEGIFRMGGHVLSGSGETYEPKPGEPIPDEHREVSAVLIKFAHPAMGPMLAQQVNKQGKVATLAWPIAPVIHSLFDRLGWVNRVLQLVAYLIVVVAAGSILASLYNTMNERRREFAILRALGARRGTVFSAIVMEATAVAGLGCVGGFAVYFAILSAAAVIVREQTGVVIDVAAFDPAMIGTPVGMLVLGALSGLLPAWKAYATDVAENLVPTS